MNDSSTYVVLQTPPGRAAVATLLVEGPRSLKFVSRSFRPHAKWPLEKFPLGRVVLGTWEPQTTSGNGDPASVLGEELIVCRLDERRIEIHCHGSRAALDAVVFSLTRQGALSRGWRDHARATQDDPLIAEALIALVSATTDRTAGILLDQVNGAFSAAMQDIDRALLEARPNLAIDQLRGILEFTALGQHLTRPWSVVLAGPPNVGKSSLLNRLLGFDRAIVFNQPGTTRDVVTSHASIDGWPVDLADTAGLRDSHDSLEREGVEHARRQLSEADLVLVVRDVSGCHQENPAESDVPAGTPILRVLNKIDLLAGSGHDFGEGVATSAVTGEGMDALRQAISTALVPRVPQASDAVPFVPAQGPALGQLLTLVEQGDLSSAREVLKNLRLLRSSDVPS